MKCGEGFLRYNRTMLKNKQVDPAQLIVPLPPDARNEKGQREIALPHAFNFRDIGGYRTDDGRFLRWGQVYRASALNQLQPADHKILQSLGLRTIFDLRSLPEVVKQPDRLPNPGPAYRHVPLVSYDGSISRLQTLRRYRRQMGQMLLHIYTHVVLGENAPYLGEMLHQLADPAHRPALFHCAVGKDRTGMVIALLLALLGVPEETIVADYTLSNRHHAAILAAMQPDFRRAVVWGWIRPSRLYPISLAHPTTMRAALQHLRQTYGSAEEYALHAAGLDRGVLAALRRELLE